MTQRCLGAYVYNLTYDVEGRLVTVTQGATTTVFNYDGDGRRVKGSVAGITFTAVGGYYERTGATTIRKYYTFNGRVVAMRQNGTLYWLLADQLGSTSMALSLTGMVQSQQRYWPWGTARNASGTLPTDYRYTWQQEVGVIGLYFYNARWYDADLKRFVQADTLVQAGAKDPAPVMSLAVSNAGTNVLEEWNRLQRPEQLEGSATARPAATDPQCLNRYTYLRNSPFAYIDASGNIALWVAGGVVGGLGGFGAYAITHRDNFSWREAALWTVGGTVLGATLGAGAQWVATTLGTQISLVGGAASTAAASTQGQQAVSWLES